MSADTLVLKVCGPSRVLAVENYNEAGDPDPVVVEAFGSHILPSPLFDVRDFDKVIEYAGDLSARNPESRVVIDWRGHRVMYVGKTPSKSSA